MPHTPHRKQDLDQLSKVMAVELGPSPYSCQLHQSHGRDDRNGQTRVERSKQGRTNARTHSVAKIRRMRGYEDIASVVCFVLSDAAGMLNGLALRVDGGFWAT